MELNITKNGTLKNNEAKSTNNEKVNATKNEGNKINKLPKAINWDKINIVDVCENKASYEVNIGNFKKIKIVTHEKLVF